MQRHHWLWVVPLLLLALLLAGRRLNSLNFTVDETYTLIYSGARNYGPYTPAEAIAAEQSVATSDQAFGWTILFNLWGGAVGWSTVALRALALFFGLLTLALLYRTGRDLFGRSQGLYASLLLVGSGVVILYFHVARVYASVLLFTTLTLWCYWRVAIDPRPAGRKWRAGLLVGGAGLVYSHYFAALLLPSLGLFHLLALRKDRRWWRTAMVFALIFLAAMPELVALRAGVAYKAQCRLPDGCSRSLPDVLLVLTNAFSNGVIDLSRGLSPLLLPPLAMAALALVRSRPRQGADIGPAWYLGVVAMAFFLVAMVANRIVPVLLEGNIRYLLALWPPVMLLVAAGIDRLERRRQRLADRLLTMLATSGVVIILLSPYQWTGGTQASSYLHLADQALGNQARTGDFLVIQEEALSDVSLVMAYYLHVWTWPRAIVSEETEVGPLLQEAGDHARLWVLAAGRDGAIDEQISGELQFCRRPVSRGRMALTLYARSEADCG